MWGNSLKHVGMIQIVILFGLALPGQVKAEAAGQAIRTLLKDEGVYSLLAKTERGKTLLEAMGLVPSAAIATDRTMSHAFQQRLISAFQYRQSEALAEKLLPRLREAQSALLREASVLQNGDVAAREKILRDISEKTLSGDDLDAALSLAKRPMLKHHKGLLQRSLQPKSDISSSGVHEEPGAMIAVERVPMNPSLKPIAMHEEIVVLVERGGLIQRLKLDYEILKLFRLKGIDLKIARLFAQNFLPSLRSIPVIFTPEEVWLFRKAVGAMGGYNTYTKFLSRMQVFAETIRPELYAQLNNSEEAIIAAREFMAEKIDISTYIAKRMEIAKEINIDKYFDPIVWKVEEEMLQGLATCKRLGQFNEATDSGLGPLELIESNTQSLRNRIQTIKSKMNASQNTIRLINAKGTKTKDDISSLKQAEIDLGSLRIDERDLTQQLFRLQKATNFQKLYWEFTQNYESLIWGNLHEGQLANLRVQPIDLAEPFLIQKELFEGSWAALYRRGFINAADPLASEEMVTLFKTLLGNARLLYQDLNKLTGGKFAQTNLGKQMNQYHESLPKFLMKRLLTWGAPAGIITEEILRRWLFDTEKDEAKNTPASDQTSASGAASGIKPPVIEPMSPSSERVPPSPEAVPAEEATPPNEGK